MFLDDIERGINKQGKKWDYWDSFSYVDLDANDRAVDFIDGIRLLAIKNLGESEVVVQIKGLRTLMKVGEEKSFPDVHGAQVLLRAKMGSGRVFVGQSRRGHTTGLPWMHVGMCVLISALVCVSGCASRSTIPDGWQDAFVVPSEPTTQGDEPVSPDMPDMPELVLVE